MVRDLYEQAGYRVMRHSYRMEISLEGGAPEPRMARGFHRTDDAARARSSACTRPT